MTEGAPPAAPKMAIVLTSGTVDRLIPFSTMVSGAVAMGYDVHVFASFWGLAAFRKDPAGATPSHPPVSPGYGRDGDRLATTLREKRFPPWKQIVGKAKSIGSLHVYACSQSMELLGLNAPDLDPLVDEVAGIATFVDRTKEAVQSYWI